MFIWDVKFRALEKVYAVRVVARFLKNAAGDARRDLLRTFPALKETTVTYLGAQSVGPQIEEVEPE